MSIFIKLVLIILNIFSYFAWVRFYLQWAKAPVYNAITQQMIKLLTPILKPFQFVCSSYKNINLPVLLLLLLVQVVASLGVFFLKDQLVPNFGGLMLLSIAQMLYQGCDVIFFATIIYAIMSWFPSLAQSDLGQCIIAVIHPIISSIRKVIPTLGIFDFSPWIVLIAIYLIQYGLTLLSEQGVYLALT